VSTTLDRIIEEVRALPPDEQKVLREMLDKEWRAAEQSRRLALSRTIRGKYSHLPTSSDDFAARKAEEIALEDRRSIS
jgi:hypothetical protein